MSGVNKVILVGNAGADAELRYSANGKAIASFRLAVNDRDQVEWVSVTCWEKLAEIVGEHVTKGKQLYVEGRLQTRSWDQDGQKRYRTEVVANTVTFLGSREPVAAGVGEVEPDDLPFDS